MRISHLLRAAFPTCAAITCAVFVALPAAGAAAQSNGERISNDRYTRSHDFDLVHQRIVLGDFNWDSTSFTGQVATTLVSLRPGLDSVILDAGALLDVARVRDSRGTALATARHGDTLVIRLARPAAFRDTVRFTLDYHGRVVNGQGLTFIQPEGRPHRPRQIWSQGEDHDNHFWFPTYDFPNDKMTWELTATVPRQYTVVSNGRKLSDHANPDGTHTVRWSQGKPASTYLVSLIVAPLAELRDNWHGIPVNYYVYHDDSAKARRLFAETTNMIDVYSRLTGVKYPWAKYAQTTVADFFGGMENLSATTLVDWLPDGHAYQDRPWYSYILIPHELAHQWFGDYTTTENWANTWLNEGFAEFMPGAYWNATLGHHATDDYYLDEYRQFMSIDGRHRMPLASLGSDNIYPKGALVLRMLERYLGEQPFWASMHAYLERHQMGNATSDDLRQAVLGATGQNLDWFWDEWVYQSGYPEFNVSAQYDTAARVLTLAIKQTQVDTATADSTGLRYATPTIFRMPVTIRVGTAGGDVIRHAQLDAREQIIRIPGLSGPPTMVIFDDGNTILKTLDFPQPTSWLATQLRTDPDLWDRSWVIGALRARTGDPEAIAALSDAATQADYYLTRAEAVDALAHFPASRSAPVLEAALRDTSSAVRRAAVTALATVGGDHATELARAVWSNDSSYEVRAAALATLSRLDSAGRSAVLAAGLSTPSYLDVIQNAALAGIARTGDTTLIPRVTALLGSTPRAAMTLATLASHDNPAALDALSQHLNDDHAYVRGWVVNALGRVTPAIVEPRLKALSDSLRYADTRSQVASVLKRLSHGTTVQ